MSMPVTKQINGKELMFVDVSDYQDNAGYKLIGKASELTEKQWKRIIERSIEFKCFYKGYGSDSKSFYETAYYSGMSLLHSLRLDPAKTLIIEKLIK